MPATGSGRSATTFDFAVIRVAPPVRLTGLDLDLPDVVVFLTQAAIDSIVLVNVSAFIPLRNLHANPLHFRYRISWTLKYGKFHAALRTTTSYTSTISTISYIRPTGVLLRPGRRPVLSSPDALMG